MPLFNKLVVKKLIEIYKSGLDPSIINHNCHHQVEQSSLLLTQFFGIFPHFEKLLVARDVTNVLMSSPNISMHSSNCSTKLSCIVLSFISILTPKRVCLLSLTTDSSSKCFFTSFMISDITFGYLCNKFLSSTYQSMVHCVPSINLLATHLP